MRAALCLLTIIVVEMGVLTGALFALTGIVGNDDLPDYAAPILFVVTFLSLPVIGYWSAKRIIQAFSSP